MPSTDPTVGTLIGAKYRVERTLGEGGMGIVYEATHAKLGHRVAVKVLRPEVSLRTDVIARFQREARIAAQLTSDHVARVTDMGRSETGELYLVMELLEGHDLVRELARRGPLPVPVAIDYVLQACEALAEAHAAGLVHRDVKPGNLFLARRPLGRPPILKVLDFGLSKAPEGEAYALTQTASSFGTPQYMSPEQVRSTKHVDARSDQHALGLVLYELLAGKPAYEAPSAAATAVTIVTAPPPQVRDIRPDIPHELNDAIVRALAKEPGDRFPDVGRFARAIARFGGPRAPEALAAIGEALASERRVAGASGTEAHAAPAPRRTAPEPGIGEEATERISLPDDDDVAATRVPPPRGAPPSREDEEEETARRLAEKPAGRPTDSADDTTTPLRGVFVPDPPPLAPLKKGGTLPMPHVLSPAAQARIAAAPPPVSASPLIAGMDPTPAAQPSPGRTLIAATIAAIVAVLLLAWALQIGPFAPPPH